MEISVQAFFCKICTFFTLFYVYLIKVCTFQTSQSSFKSCLLLYAPFFFNIWDKTGDILFPPFKKLVIAGNFFLKKKNWKHCSQNDNCWLKLQYSQPDLESLLHLTKIFSRFHCCLAVLAELGEKKKTRNWHLLEMNDYKDTDGNLSWATPFWFGSGTLSIETKLNDTPLPKPHNKSIS